MFFVIAIVLCLFSLIDFAVGNHEAAWKLVVLGSLFLNLYYLNYIFLRVREIEKFIEFMKKNPRGQILSNFNYPFNPNGPCRECHDRYPACHDKCESYISYKKDYDKKQRRIKADKYLHSLSFPMSTHPKRREL